MRNMHVKETTMDGEIILVSIGLTPIGETMLRRVILVDNMNGHSEISYTKKGSQFPTRLIDVIV